MTQTLVNLSASLKQLGYTTGNQIKLYGEVLEVISEPIVIAEDTVQVDATETKSGQSKRVSIPLPIVHMAGQRRRAA
jgi:septum formation topological specificity factor MinE